MTIVNIKLISAVVLASAIAAPAFADGDHHYPADAGQQPVAAAHGPAHRPLDLHLHAADTSRPAAAGLSRAEVRADLAKARALDTSDLYRHG